MGDIPATYEITPEPERPAPPPGASAGQMALIIGAIGLTLAVALAALGGWLHYRGVSSSQAAQIHGLNVANARLSGEVGAQSAELTRVSARLAAADPAADGSLITCADLRRMGLVATTGGSVSSVPGSVGLSQARVPLPAHCARS